MTLSISQTRVQYILLLIISLIGLIYCGKCPSSEIVSPCICRDDMNSIMCGGNTSIDLKEIFLKISLSLDENDKNFGGFYLANTAITELEDNVFHDVTFSGIVIEYAESLKKIHANAFTSVADTVEYFYLFIEPGLGNEVGDYRNLFDALSSLKNVKEIHLTARLTEIPENAFTYINGLQNNLVFINFNYGSYCSTCQKRITKIGSNAFYYLNNLHTISISNHNISYISADAFRFREYTQKKLAILLSNNNLNGSSFESKAFLFAKRPLQLDLSDNQLNFLDEQVFAPFLHIDERNSLLLKNNPFDCNCNMFWIFKIKDQIQSRLQDVKCKDGTLFWDLNQDHFVHCRGVL